MGVKSLWSILNPTGRKAEVAALGNKVVAVDASIWIVQFIKVMRNQDGSMQAGAHLKGMFHRLCKLLSLKVKPVIVFDGVMPALKRKTNEARRKLQSRSKGMITKLAEQLLRNKIKAHSLAVQDAKKEREAAARDDAENGKQKAPLDFSNPHNTSASNPPKSSGPSKPPHASSEAGP
eukprot:CAMPEP_0169454110 /NCGR_PEP_ID=MMETSP1042-20121227/15105_1 /TAXON_ID=464988 /ORGANISM="Hemiselmis andersenii, Strain CCMP1180" /LENGTH=176 /DNA_ID=CAMNT_0009566165 /DNA_START=72 /DNA_END=598 /DNA_ORIENTATION=-